jgi:hypothetical protein
MSNAIENARKRLAELKEEIAEIERFLQLWERFEAGTNADHLQNVPGKEPLPVDNSGGRRRRIQGARPDEVAFHMERVIRDRGEPMSRSEIVKALEARDILIPALDKSRYVGTIAWRNKATFKNIEGRGYWLCNEPLPAPRQDDPSNLAGKDGANPFD